MNTTFTLPTLHDLFNCSNFQAFAEALRPSKRNVGYTTGYSNLSSSLSKSPRFNEGTSHAPANVVNRRDWAGRTVLHLAASSLDDKALAYVDLLLQSPNVNVNLQDSESGWTPLHRALYAGNLVAAKLLTAQTNCDMSIKDHEGFTALDVWNSTIEGTNPTAIAEGTRLDLFTWGSNKDFVLGFSNDNDRPLPERVSLRRKNVAKKVLQNTVGSRAISLSKVASGVVTTETNGNVRFCGHSHGGKLGKSGHTQFHLEPLADFNHKIESIALGLDHTVLLTSSGEVFTYGLNHFGQLGFALDATKPGEEPVQSSPRKIPSLKKEIIKGIAASKYHTACFSADALYTFGANKGQLGYKSGAIQIQPRQVSNVPGAIMQVVASDLATACLLDTSDIFVLFGGNSFKMSFSMHRFPTGIKVYRPPTQKPSIAKLAAGGTDLLAISDMGDVYQWKLDDAEMDTAQASRSAFRLWDLRRKFTAVVDAAVYNDSVILCTRSGHVYIREKRKEGADKRKDGMLKASLPMSTTSRGKFKFTRVPFLQRAVAVSTNGYGAYGAIRSDVAVPKLPEQESAVCKDVLSILPHWQRLLESDPALNVLLKAKSEEFDDETLERDVVEGLALCQLADNWDAAWEEPLHGSDLAININGKKIPAHSSVLCARSPVLLRLLAGHSSDSTGISYNAKARLLNLNKTSMLVTFLLLHYLYCDSLPFLWDPRVKLRIQSRFTKLAVTAVREDLQRLAHLLQLPALGRLCGALEKVTCVPTLISHLSALQPTAAGFSSQSSTAESTDLTLKLSDGLVHCHSAILRARCPFFAAFLGNPIWTAKRWTTSSQARILEVDLQHISSENFEYVLRYVYRDSRSDLFDYSDLESSDKAIDLIVSILALADELMIDQLKLVCSQELIRFVDLRTAGSILLDADTFHARDLADSCAYYLCCNFETVLESGYIKDLPPFLLQRLAEYGRTRQGLRMPLTRSNILVDVLIEKHKGWLEEQDIPKSPTGLPHRARQFTRSPQLSPVSFPNSPSIHPSAMLSPPLLPHQSKNDEPSPVLLPIRTEDDDLFAIDDLDIETSEKFPDSPTPNKRGWAMPSSAQGTSNMRQIMAAQQSASPLSRQGIYKPPIRRASGERVSTSSVPSLTPLPTTSAGWSRPVPSKMSLLSIQAQQQSQPNTSPPVRAGNAQLAASAASTPVKMQLTRSSPSARSDPTSAVGAPVISPLRSVSNSNSTNKRSQEAWVNYTTTSSFLAPAVSPPAGRSSFSAIQDAQQSEGDELRNLRKAPRSLAEIQAEEEFDLWWANEEKKIRDQEATTSAQSSEPPRRGKTSRGNANRGRGKTHRGKPSTVEKPRTT